MVDAVRGTDFPEESDGMDNLTSFAREFVLDSKFVDDLYISGSPDWSKMTKRFFRKYRGKCGVRMTLKFLFVLYFRTPEFGKTSLRPIFFIDVAKKHWSVTENILMHYDPTIETIYTFLPSFRVCAFLEKLRVKKESHYDLLPHIYSFLPEKYKIYRTLDKNFFTKKLQFP